MNHRFDTQRLNDVLAGGPWPHGKLESVGHERIGESFGLSAEIHRLHATTTDGRSVSLVAKVEHLDGTRRAIAAHRHVTPSLDRATARLWGAEVPMVGDPSGDETEDGPTTGMLLLEDIAPAEQGDELSTPSTDRGLELVRLVARIHEVSVPTNTADVETWQAFVSPAERWAGSVDRVVARYPELFGNSSRRLLALRDDALDATVELNGADSTWIHVDPHLDNVLWRPDGSAVLIDWSNTRVGPSEVDLAVVLFTLSFGETEVLVPDDVIEAYATARKPGTVDTVAVLRRTRAALTLHTRGVFGWVGEGSNDGFHDRKAELRDGSARRIARVLEWLDA